ncbi:MAG: hypothetical protein HXK70_05335 [Clostridiales bacterium]|jgi:hypothetical protein|nr:hypothetical protein [Clostridiales bacterium]
MEKKIRMIIRNTITSKKGSFRIEQIRKEIVSSLKENNFNDEVKNEKITSEYLNNLINDKKLFRYSNENEYFYIH